MKNILFKGFAVLAAVLFFSSLANAQTRSDDAYASYQSDVSAAISSGDADLVANIVANAINKNPKLAGRIIAYIVSKYPSAAVAIVKAVQSISPDNAADVASMVTNELEKNPNNQALIAQVLEATSPAAGQGNNSNNIPDFVTNQGANPAGVSLPDAVTENPSITSGN